MLARKLFLQNANKNAINLFIGVFIMKFLSVLILSLGMATALTACDDGGAENVGEEIDRGIDDIGDTLDDAGDSIGDKLDDAGNSLEDACEDATGNNC